MLRTLTTIAASLALAAGACAQENGFETTDLGDGIYMIANDRAGNVGLIDAGDHLIMIDTQMPPFLDDLESAVREASGGRAPTLVINTHFHGDHVLGNAHFAALGAGILAHRNVAERLANPVLNQLTGRTPEALGDDFLPDILVSQAMMLMQFGVTGEVLHFANAHTDGDIMPIIDQLIDANPHALHSLDPQGGVDIAEVKRLYGHRVCLIGNVNCGLLDTGTDEQAIESTRYALRHGMPGGGYIFSTSNCIYTGMRLSRYELMLDVWRREGYYNL